MTGSVQERIYNRDKKTGDKGLMSIEATTHLFKGYAADRIKLAMATRAPQDCALEVYDNPDVFIGKDIYYAYRNSSTHKTTLTPSYSGQAWYVLNYKSIDTKTHEYWWEESKQALVPQGSLLFTTTFVTPLLGPDYPQPSVTRVIEDFSKVPANCQCVLIYRQKAKGEFTTEYVKFPVFCAHQNLMTKCLFTISWKRPKPENSNEPELAPVVKDRRLFRLIPNHAVQGHLSRNRARYAAITAYV